MRAVLVAGVSSEQIEDALAASFTYTIDRLADAFGFFVPGLRPSPPERSSCSPAATAEEAPVPGAWRLKRWTAPV
jgi:hypothetical protein